MTRLGKAGGVLVGVKGGSTSPANTVAQLKGWLKELQDDFDTLKRAAEPAANQVSRLSDSMQKINEAATNIVKFSEDLSKKLQDVRAKSNSKLNPDSTVFSSFSDLVDIMTKSVDETKLAKFQSISRSLRAFSSSLTDIVAFSKDANGDVFKKFVKDLGSKDSTNTKNKVFSFINKFMPTKEDDINALNANLQKMGEVVSSVKKYVSVLNGLKATGAKDVGIPKEWDDARERFYKFLRGFGTEGDVPDAIKHVNEVTKPIAKYISELKSLNKLGNEGGIDTAKWDKTRQAFYDFLRGFGTEGDVPASIERLGTLTKAIGKYLSEIKALTSTGGIDEAGIKKWNDTRQAFYDFLRGFGTEGDVPDALDRLNTLTKAMGKYTTILSQLQRFGKAGGIDTKAWDDTRLAFYTFLRGFGTEGDVPDALSRLNQLTKGMLKYTSILTTLNKTGSVTPETVKSWNDTRLEFYNFLRGFGTEGDIPDAIKRINQLMAGIYKYSQVLNTMQRVGSVSTTDVDKWNVTRQAFYDFLRSFGTGGDVKDSYERLNKLVAGMYKYAQVLNTLQRVGAVDSNATGAWETTRQEIIKFIESFKSQGTPTDEELDKAAARANKLMTGIAKYANVLRTLKSIGSDVPDLNALNTVRTEVFKFINEFGETGNQTDDEKLNKSAARASKLMSGLAKYAEVLRTLQRVGEIDTQKDPDKWKKTKGAVFDFITLFEHKGVDADDKLDATAKRINKLMSGLVKYSEAIRTLQSIGSVGDTVPDKWKDTQKAVMEFIKSFQKTGIAGTQRAEEEAVDSGAERLSHLMKGLVKYTDAIRGLRSVGDIGTMLPGLVPSTWTNTQQAVLNFIKGFGRSDDPALQDAEDALDAAGKRLNDLVKGLVKYTDAVRGLQSAKDVKIGDPTKWKRMSILVRGFIKTFKDTGTQSDKDLTDAANRLNDLMKGMVKYTNVLKSLQSIGKVSSNDITAWTTTRDEFIKFINGFAPANQNDLKILQQNAKLVEDIGKSLQKFASVAKTMVGLGTFDPVVMSGNLKTFIKELTDVIKDPNITSISKDLQKKFSNIANSFKGISQFINSITKGSFASFAPNLQAAIPLLRLFIEETAKLTKLSAFPDFERVANAVGKFNGKLQDMTKTINQSSRAMTKLHSLMRQIYTAFVGGAVVYSIVRTIKSAIKEMFNLEYAMARVNTIARVSSGELKNVTHFVQDMSATYGVASSKVTKALYDINSATIKGSASLKILEQSVKLAVAGFTDVEKVSDLIAKAVNAYEYSASEAAKISDILFVTVERGINPMEELSEYFGRLFTVSANAGVSLEEVGAGLATLTARGYQTNVASTALNSAILKLSTGTKELNKLFQQYGYASSASALRTIGLSGALQILNKATNGATEKLHDLGFNYRDIRAATTLASGAISEYNKTLDLMTDKNYTANKTAEALAKVQDTVKYKVEQLKETYTTFVQSIAEYLDKNKEIKAFLDILRDSFESATKAMRGFNLTLTEQLGAGFVNLIPKLIATYGVFRLLNPILLKSGNLFRGFYLVHKLAPNATLTLRGIFIGLKGIGSALKGVLGSLGTAMKWLVVVQGSLEVISEFVTVIKEGTFWSGLADLTGLDALFKGDIAGYFKTMYANVEGLRGALVDAFTGFSTNFREEWRNEVKKADYVDDEAIAKNYKRLQLSDLARTNTEMSYADRVSDFKRYALEFDIPKDVLQEFLNAFKLSEFRKSVVPVIADFKNLRNRLSEFGYSEEQISIEYDNVRSKLLDFADTFGLTQEEFNVFVNKTLNDANDSVIKVNNELKKLLPNTQALKDVFEYSRKAIADNFEKHAGELQKIAQKLSNVDNAMEILSKGLGISVEQVATMLSSPSNFEELEKKIFGGIEDFAGNINEALKDAISDKNIGKVESAELLEEFYANIDEATSKAMIKKYDELYGKRVYYKWKNPLGRNLYGERVEESKLQNREQLINALKTDAKFRDVIAENFADYNDVLNNSSEIILKKHIKAYSDNVMNTLFNLDLNADQKAKIEENEDKIRKELEAKYSIFQNQPKAFVDFIVEEMKLVPEEMRSALQVAVDNFHEANQGGLKFIKTLVDFSSTISKMSSEFKIGDVISNKLGITEVDYFKKQMLRSLGIADGMNLDYYFEIMAEDMRKKIDPTIIMKKMATVFKDIGVISADMSEKDAQNLVGTLFDLIIAMAKAYDDFSKQYNKLDYLKHLNKLNYGGEMSAFNKYKDIGSKMISDLKATIISTKDGDKAFEALYTEFNSKLFGGMDFDKVVEEFSTNYGDDAFKEFINKFKEFDGYIKEFVTEINELDFMKFVNRLKFGNELSAFKQFKEVDSKKIADIMERRLVDGTDAVFKDILDYAVQYGNEATEKMLIEKYQDRGKEIYTQYANTLKEYEDTMKGSPFVLQTQYKGIKKQLRDFIRNYEDAFLSPLQQFNKTEDKLKRQLAKVRKQAKEGVVDPDAVGELIKTAENLQKLNEETMNIKVPAAITASEAVRTGSKEAFDLVARNIFKDTYKVNVRQANYQKEIVNVIKDMRDKIKTSEQTAVSLTLP